jgi:hypothetical protein
VVTTLAAVVAVCLAVARLVQAAQVAAVRQKLQVLRTQVAAVVVLLKTKVQPRQAVQVL